MAAEAQDLVVDASIVVKWFVPEQDSEHALKLRDAHAEGRITLYAPDLLVYEVANALRYRADLAAGDLESDIEALFLVDIMIMTPSSRSVSRAALKARQYGVTVYDAAYMELAEDIGSQLVTADDKLYKKAGEKGVATLLQNYLKKVKSEIAK